MLLMQSLLVINKKNGQSACMKVFSLEVTCVSRPAECLIKHALDVGALSR